MAYAMGGRAAEEIVFHDPSTGASNDIQKATDTARKMVTDYGMSAVIGSVKLGGEDTEPFLGGGGASARNYSDETAAKVDAEIRALLEQAHDEAFQILLENRDILDRLAFALLEKETLLENEIAEIFKDVRKRPEREHWYSKPTRERTDIPPVKAPSELAQEAQKAEEAPAEAPTVPVAPTAPVAPAAPAQQVPVAPTQPLPPQAPLSDPDADPTVAMPTQQYPNYPAPPAQRPENGTPNQNGAENERG
jgi:ATP-dependent zinc metalloprotease ftsH